VKFISPTKVFSHLDRMAGWQRGERPAPVTVEFDLSNRCVLGCQSCHFAHTHTRGPWVMRDRRLPMAFDDVGDVARTLLVLGALDQMSGVGVQGVVWTGGGEPTTHPQWQEIVDHAAAVGIQQGMYTLGGLFRRESAHFLAERAAWVVVSLDCADPITYHHEKGVPLERFAAACDGVRWLAEAGRATVGVSFLLHAANWHNAEAMLALARRLGANYTTFRPTIETSPSDPSTVTGDRSWITEAIPTLLALEAEPDVECHTTRFVEYRDWLGRSYGTCYGVRFNATITPDLRVWLCPQRRGIPDSLLGDLRVEPFSAIWARHPGRRDDLADCRVMCRLHLMNEQLAAVYATRRHEAFV
jgi:MoaA/NifB/PqqE/SkfB family radical SAM enzyme